MRQLVMSAKFSITKTISCCQYKRQWMQIQFSFILYFVMFSFSHIFFSLFVEVVYKPKSLFVNPFCCSCQGVIKTIICLHLNLFSEYFFFFLTATIFVSYFTSSMNLIYNLPPGHLPGSSNLSIHLPIYFHHPSSVHVQAISTWDP